jgi:hypothetical protein
MSIAGSPIGQIAYQTVLMKNYAAAWNPYVRTTNRYCSGPTGAQANSQTGDLVAMPQRAIRCARNIFWFPTGGAALQVTNVGVTGNNYVIGDLVTMAPINGGRPVIVAVRSLTGSAPNLIEVIDPGSGMTGGGTGVSAPTSQTAALTQASTTGIGTGATWQALLGIGWGLGPQPRPNA